MPSLSSVQHLSRLKTECSIKTIAAHFHEGRAHVPTVDEKIDTDDSPFSGLGPIPSVLAHANCTPFFSPKHLDLVTEKYSFFAILKILFFKPSQKTHFSSVLPIFCCF